jgi:hypothetical protein
MFTLIAHPHFFMEINDKLRTLTKIFHSYTVKPVYNDHPKIVAVVDRWSLFRVIYVMKTVIECPNGGRYRQVVAIWRWS